MREALSEVSREVGRFTGAGRYDGEGDAGAATKAPPAPEWAGEPGTGDPARDFDRLLDRFRDDLRDAARDHGVTADQLRESRRQLSTTAARIGALLRGAEPSGPSADPEA